MDFDKFLAKFYEAIDLIRCLLSKLLTDEKTFKGFSIFSSGSHFVRQSGIV